MLVLNRIRQLLGLDEWKKLRLTAGEYSIAILDSGICEHPDLIGRIVAFEDFINHRKQPYDDYGHGTHIAGIIGGNGIQSNGKFEGILPRIDLIGLKVLDAKGNGDYANIRHAFLWILKNKDKYNIKIINVSIGLENTIGEDEQTELAILLNALNKESIITVVAAGNNGPMPMSLSRLADSDKVISVGCHDLGYQSRYGKNYEEYSARGPGSFSIKKPDLVAPGTDIISCSTLNRKKRTNYYARKSGTSMATAIVCATIGMKINQYPEISMDWLKHSLFYSATNLNEPWNKQGWGMINPKDFLNYDKSG